MNSYLTLAAKVLEEAQEPLSSRQILRAAYQLQIVPTDLYGKTQHKTLQARLSEDILRSRTKSEFVRTAPGRFYLRRLLTAAAPRPIGLREHHAPLRADQLRRFHVLCIPDAEVAALRLTVGRFFKRQQLEKLSARYERLSSVIKDQSLYHVQVFVVLCKGDQLLTSAAADSSEECLDRRISVGLFGFVKREDHTMFSVDKLGLNEAALRTILEQLPVPPEAVSELQPAEMPRQVECLVQGDADPQEKIVMAMQLYAVPHDGALDTAIQMSGAFGWKPVPDRINNLESYDQWSRLLIQERILGHFAIA